MSKYRSPFQPATLFFPALLTIVASAAGAAAEPLPGFRLSGTKWTYTDGPLSMEGILMKPEGDGPFPALLLSHGRGGNAEGFGASKAREFVKLGYVCIAPNYSFAGPVKSAADAAAKSEPGASEDNLRRASKCLDILRSLTFVDGKRLAAYGNDMGASVTIGLSAKEPARLIAAAVTAGGIGSGIGMPAVSSSNLPRVPLCIIHGGNDTTVPPETSLNLKELLDANHVPNERHVIAGAPHKVHQENADEVYRLIQAWFIKQGVIKGKV